MVPGIDSPISLAPNDPRLTVQRYIGVHSKARRTYLYGLSSPEYRYLVYNASIVNLERAIKERVLYVQTGDNFARPPRPISKPHFFGNMQVFTRLLRNKLGKTARITPHQFAGLYSGRRRAVYEKAADTLLTRGVRRRDAELRSFVKAEKVIGKAPRVIQPRDPVYNVAVGVFLKPLEGRVVKAIARLFGEKTIMKGMNARQVGRCLAVKWSKFRDPIAVSIDASRFDQHCSAIALEWEHSVYLGCFTDNSELRKLLQWQIDNKGRGYCKDGKLKYSVHGCRMSGDMNTGMGNCLIMCALVFSYMLHVGIVKYSLVNNGDDCVIIMERGEYQRFIDGFMEWFHLMGYTMKAEEPVDVLERIDFCQTQPVFDGTGYIMVRNPYKALAKDCVALKPLDTPGAFKKYTEVFAEGGMSLTGGIPIWQEFYHRMARCASAVALPRKRRHKANKMKDDPAFETGMMMLSRGMRRKYGPIDPHTRVSFWLAFGYTPQQQMVIEDHYRNTEFSYNVETQNHVDGQYLGWFIKPQ